MDQNSNVITLNPEAPVILGHTGNSMSLFVILVYKNSVEFRRVSPHSGRYRIAEHRRKIRKLTAHGTGNETLVSQPHTEPLNRVRDHTSVQLSIFLEVRA